MLSGATYWLRSDVDEQVDLGRLGGGGGRSSDGIGGAAGHEIFEVRSGSGRDFARSFICCGFFLICLSSTAIFLAGPS